MRLTSSASSLPKILGAASRTVTLLPKARKIQANSIPMTPPPIMSKRGGTSERSRISSLDKTPGRSFPGMSSSAFTEPLAIRIRFPSTSWPSARTFPGDSIDAWPRITSTPLPFSRSPTPVTRFCTIFSLRCLAAPRSKSQPAIPPMPNSLILDRLRSISAFL